MPPSVKPDISIKTRRMNSYAPLPHQNITPQIITTLAEIDIESGIIPAILLKLLTTNQITTSNNKNVWRSLLSDNIGTFITLTEWGSSILSQFKSNADIILNNYSIKQMITDQYSVNYNIYNIELEPLSTSKIIKNMTKNTIKNIGLYRNLKALANIKLTQKDKKLISFCGILIKKENQKINNRSCLRLTILDSLSLKDTIEMTSWKVSEAMNLNHLYTFRNILIKSNGNTITLSSGNYITSLKQ
jgi:hypothetical protein